MYAIIESGNQQNRVKEGEVLRLAKIDAPKGEKISFDKVLMLGEGESVIIGTPYVDAKVNAEIIDQGRGDKVTIIKFNRRKHYRKQQGHRQDYTVVKITSITSKEKVSATTKNANDKKIVTSENKENSKTSTPKAATQKPATSSKNTSSTSKEDNK